MQSKSTGSEANPSVIALNGAERPETVIEHWTKEDYMSESGEPYKWLYDQRENAYLFNRLKTIMAEAAKEAGVRNFGALLRAYGESMVGKSAARQAGTVTQFDGQQLELSCGEYICNEYGVSYESNFGGVIVVCPHPIMPIKRLVNIDTGEVKIELAYQRGKRWNTMIFDKATLSNARSITALSSVGISVTSESAKELVKYLAFMEDANYDLIPEEKTVGRLGWVDGYGFSPYVDALRYDNADQFSEEFKAVRTGGSFEEWLKVARGARASDAIPTRIALAASFASVLVKKFNALPFIVHLWGSVAGIGKSVALILAGSVWAYPEIGYYVKTTKATDVALEHLAFFAGNMPLCLDELQLIQSRKNFDEIVYSLCEGAGKARGAKTGGLQSVKRWCNCTITTGEMPVTSANSKAGAVNRVIEVECTEKTFPDPRAAYQALVHNYGHAGKMFVERLQSDSDAIEIAQAVQQDYYNQMTGKATDKQVLTASIILAADYMADLYVFNDGNCLTPNDILPFLVTKESADTNIRAYEWLCDWIAVNANKFNPVVNEDTYMSDCWGCFERDKDDMPTKCFIIKSVFDRNMQENGFNPASFLSWAAKNGKIERSKKQYTKLKRITSKGNPARCVVLNLPGIEPESAVTTFEATNEEIPF